MRTKAGTRLPCLHIRCTGATSGTWEPLTLCTPALQSPGLRCHCKGRGGGSYTLGGLRGRGEGTAGCIGGGGRRGEIAWSCTSLGSWPTASAGWRGRASLPQDLPGLPFTSLRARVKRIKAEGCHRHPMTRCHPSPSCHSSPQLSASKQASGADPPPSTERETEAKAVS